MNMKYSKSGLRLTEGFESVRLKAYQDLHGVWTIGWGHTASVYPSMVITQSQAISLLLGDVASAVATVNNYVKIQLTQNEFDACVDFCFNCGNTAFRESTMLKLINQNQLQLAADEFDKWDHAAGKEVAGLLRRRNSERDLFEEHSVA